MARVGGRPRRRALLRAPQSRDVVGGGELRSGKAVRTGLIADEGRTVPSVLPARRLDLDHLDAEVGEDAPDERAADVGQLDGAHLRERSRHARVLARATRAGQGRVRTAWSATAGVRSGRCAARRATRLA